MGPITLKQGHKADVWVGVVAGRDQAELFQNAAAATADANSRN